MGDQKNSCAEAFADAVEINDELKHLDISFNRFNYDEITMIGEKLKANHTIMGIHL